MNGSSDRLVHGSVQNRAPRLRVKREDGTVGDVVYFAIPYPKMLHAGRWRFVSAGGAAKLTKEGRRLLLARFPGIILLPNNMDARFWVKEAELDQVFAVILDGGEAIAEIGSAREIHEEMTGHELSPAFSPILDTAAVNRIRATYVTPMYQPRVGLASSINAPGEQVRRLMRLHQLEVPQDVYDRLAASPLVRIFRDPSVLPGVDDAEHKTVSDPRRPGETMEIGTNLFVF